MAHRETNIQISIEALRQLLFTIPGTNTVLPIEIRNITNHWLYDDVLEITISGPDDIVPESNMAVMEITKAHAETKTVGAIRIRGR